MLTTGSVFLPAQKYRCGFDLPPLLALMMEMYLSLLASLLGYCIVIPSFVVQVPQIVKIWRAGSAEGISLSSIIFDLFAFTVGGAFNWAKGYPFSAWGELVPAIIQTTIVATLVIR